MHEQEGAGGTSKLEDKFKRPDPYFAEHLNGLFPALHFPPELARRILTHSSHPAATYGHNGAYSFIGSFSYHGSITFLTIFFFSGRRILEAYLLLMLNSSAALHSKHDLSDIVTRTLNSYTLGERVGSVWGLGRVMRWTPTIPVDKLKLGDDNREMLKSVGLYKVQGEAVSAVMGGIFYQFVSCPLSFVIRFLSAGCLVFISSSTPNSHTMIPFISAFFIFMLCSNHTFQSGRLSITPCLSHTSTSQLTHTNTRRTT